MKLQRTARLSARTTAGQNHYDAAERALRMRRQVVADAYDYIVESYPTQLATPSVRSARSAHRTA
ncbi:hypothetical protein [Streptomyces erythrochromogenes]|uniref:hypothetical protein n=1 Tax=Streptomyces erythrochromogenes TaxID=285574 RepID=UPI0037D85315